MKKFLKGIFAVLLCLGLSITIVGCGNDEQSPISLSAYFSEVVKYNTYTRQTSSTTANLEDLLAEDFSKQFTNITLTGKQKWLSYMTIEKVVYTFVANKDVALDLTLKITRIDGEGENFKFDSSEDVYYFSDMGTLELYKDTPLSIEFYVGGVMQDNKDITFSLDIDKTIYIEEESVDPKMNISLKNIEIYGEHK